MLQTIREKAQGWIAWVIVILITIPFALWGIGEYVGIGGEPVVATVNGQEITERDYENRYQQFRNELRQRLGNAYGIWSQREPAGRIWIENISARPIAGGQALVVYEEWQDSGDGPRGRLSTALLKTQENSPNGLEWLHVHETWLPE